MGGAYIHFLRGRPYFMPLAWAVGIGPNVLRVRAAVADRHERIRRMPSRSRHLR